MCKNETNIDLFSRNYIFVLKFSPKKKFMCKNINYYTLIGLSVYG